MFAHFLKKSVSDFFVHRDQLSGSHLEGSSFDTHLSAATVWLTRSIEACGGNASAKSYRFMRGWMPAYPETSGYIIPTLLALSAHQDDPQHKQTAIDVADWLLSIQLSNGGFVGREVGVQNTPDVFDSGMILLGLNGLIKTTGEDRFVSAAERVAQFLVDAMDEDGCFTRNVSHNMVHTYNVRSAWGLLAFAKLTSAQHYEDAALKNIRWTLGQQRDNGFFDNNAFKPGGNPNSHGLAYVMRALLQAYKLTDDDAFLKAVVKPADNIVDLYRKHGWIPAEIGPNWSYESLHICLTGYAQLAIIFYHLYEHCTNPQYKDVADSMLNRVAQSQDIVQHSAPHFGGIPGSFPIYGAYAPLQYPNWATKFFIDAILLRDQSSRANATISALDLYSG